MKVIDTTRGMVSLGRRDFVAQGGEAAVYAKSGVAYKLYTDPGAVIPVGKLRELGSITDPNVIKPERFVTDPRSRRPIGYAMRHVPDGYSLCQLFPPTFRERHDLSPQRAFELVQALRRQVASIHRAGARIVDLSELNVLASHDLRELYFIDVDSYQTAHFPATAITPSVADPLVVDGHYTELSDWFSFAVVTFQLLVGIHPYKGTHPRVRGLIARKEQHLSVFDDEVSLPRVCYPLEVIPAGYRAWYRAVLQQAARLPPPVDPGGVVVVGAPPPLGAGTSITLAELAQYDTDVVDVWDDHGGLVIRTQNGVWVDRRQLQRSIAGHAAVGWTRRAPRPVLASLDDRLRLLDLTTATELAVAAQADELMGYDGRVYIRSGDKILELVFHEVGPAVIAAVEHVADVLPHATQLFEGVALQSLLGATYAMLFPQSGTCHAVRVPELDGCQVVDAKYDHQVLMVVRAVSGSYDRLVFRFDGAFARYDVREVADVGPCGLNFVTLDSGVCVCLAEDDSLEVFSNRKDSPAFKRVVDDALGADLTLRREPGRVLCHRGSSLFRLSLR